MLNCRKLLISVVRHHQILNPNVCHGATLCLTGNSNKKDVCNYNICKFQYAHLHNTNPSYADKLKPLHEIGKKKRGANTIYDLEPKMDDRYQTEVIKGQERTPETFMKSIDVFKERTGNQRTGNYAFIYGALKEMKKFKVNRDLKAYKALMSVFPEGKLKAQTFWQTELYHSPVHQDAAIALLDYLERNCVLPDEELGSMIIKIFGQQSHVMRKYQRMMYWMPKFRHSNPYELPEKAYINHATMASAVLRRMCVDRHTRFTYSEYMEEGETDPTFIVSAQSKHQEELLAEQPTDKPLVVEGGFFTWGYGEIFLHFILRSQVTEKYMAFENKPEEKEEDDTNFDFTRLFRTENPNEGLAVPPSEHEMADGTVLAMTITRTSSYQSLRAWLNQLQEENPRLAEIPVMFRMSTPEEGFPIMHGDTELEQEDIDILFPKFALNHKQRKQLEEDAKYKQDDPFVDNTREIIYYDPENKDRKKR